jgi:DNA-binding NtrC family response regulator
MNNLPATTPRHENITLLTVNSNAEDRLSLKRILGSNGWTIQGAESIREATPLLKARPSLILCEKDLPDGNWKDIFREAQRLDNSAPFVVVSRNADQRLWAEVLNLGGFDVLLKPFVWSEVKRVMSMACRHAVPAPTRALFAAV